MEIRPQMLVNPNVEPREAVAQLNFSREPDATWINILRLKLALMSGEDVILCTRSARRVSNTLCYVEFVFRKCKHKFLLYIISQHLNGAGGWHSSSRKTNAPLSNTWLLMTWVRRLARSQGASAGMLLTQLSRNVPFHHQNVSIWQCLIIIRVRRMKKKQSMGGRDGK